jgi:hypothetical protein
VHDARRRVGGRAYLFKCTNNPCGWGCQGRAAYTLYDEQIPPMTGHHVSLALPLARERGRGKRQCKLYVIRSPDFRRRSDHVCYKAAASSYPLRWPAIPRDCSSYHSHNPRGSHSYQVLSQSTWPKTSLARRSMTQMPMFCTDIIPLRLPQ